MLLFTAYIPRGVFVRILRENPELHGAKLRFLQFLCIAERVTVRGTAFFSRAVNSNYLIAVRRTVSERLQRIRNRMRFNMEINDILKLIEAVSEHGLTSFVLEENGSKISMKKEKEVITVTAAPAVIAPAAADARDISGTAPSGPAGYMAPAVSAAGTEMSRSESIGSDKVVTSPLVGTFYNAASPDSDAFVSVGDTVKKGQVLGIIEAMKLMNEIESEYDGVVEAVLVNNEEVVEYGQPLFRIR